MSPSQERRDPWLFLFLVGQKEDKRTGHGCGEGEISLIFNSCMQAETMDQNSKKPHYKASLFLPVNFFPWVFTKCWGQYTEHRGRNRKVERNSSKTLWDFRYQRLLVSRTTERPFKGILRLHRVQGSLPQQAWVRHREKVLRRQRESGAGLRTETPQWPKDLGYKAERDLSQFGKPCLC